MNPIKLNESALTLVGVCAANKDATSAQQTRNTLIYTLMIVMHIINITATSLFFIKFITIDYNGALYGLLAATVLICMLYILVTLRYHRNQMRAIFSTLDSIYQNSKALIIFHLINKNFAVEWVLPKILDVTIKRTHSPLFADRNSKAFEDSSYSNRIGRFVSIFCIQIYPPAFFIMSVAVTSIDVGHCYFHDGLTNVTCLQKPYRYV